MNEKQAYENCERAQKLHDSAALGEWNALVVKGETKEIRRERLSNAPVHLQEQIKLHVITVFKLKSKK